MESPFLKVKKVKAKGGGTKKVCLPLAKIRSMSKGEKSSVINAKRKAGAAGKYKRSSKSNVTGTSSGGSLKNWIKQDWRQVANPSLKCGANDSGTGAAAGGGMTQKGVDSYKAKNPKSKLQTAVTKDPKKIKPGSKEAKRRKAFCARSKKWKSKRGLAARRRWNC